MLMLYGTKFSYQQKEKMSQLYIHFSPDASDYIFFSKLSPSVCKILSCLQAELFDKFLHGSTLEECYSAVASVANRWLDLLDVRK